MTDLPLRRHLPLGPKAATLLVQPRSASDLRDSVKIGIFWRSGSQVLGQIIAWSATLIVMRLLHPSDYGVFAISLLVVGLLTILNGSGIARALVQQRELSLIHIRQAFGLLLIANMSLAVGQWIAAPYVAATFAQPILTDILRIQTLIYLSTPFIAIPEAVLSRQLEFRKQGLISLGAAITGALVAVLMALGDFGIWTLAYPAISMFWVRALGLTYLTKILVWPRFQFRGCGSMVRFGAALILGQFLGILQTQSDIFIAGHIFAPEDVGLYSQATFLATLIYARFLPPLNDVAFSAYARLQDDLPGLRRAFLKSARLILLVAAPLCIGMGVTAGPLVTLAFGAQWHGLTPLLSTLALAMPFMTLQTLFTPALHALNRPDLANRTSLAGAIIFGLSFGIAAQWGVVAMAAIWCLAAPSLLLATLYIARPVLQIGFRPMAETMALPMAMSLAMGLAVWAIDHWFISATWQHLPMVHFPLLVALGGAFYVCLIAIFGRAWLRQCDWPDDRLP